MIHETDTTPMFQHLASLINRNNVITLILENDNCASHDVMDPPSLRREPLRQPCSSNPKIRRAGNFAMQSSHDQVRCKSLSDSDLLTFSWGPSVPKTSRQSLRDRWDETMPKKTTKEFTRPAMLPSFSSPKSRGDVAPVPKARSSDHSKQIADNCRVCPTASAA